MLGTNMLFMDGLESMLSAGSNFDIVGRYGSTTELLARIKNQACNILIVVISRLTDEDIALIKYLNDHIPKVPVMVISDDEKETTIFRTLKAGAKGFLNTQSDKNELYEAVYTLRNGHDYYSKSISRILINKYLHEPEVSSDSLKMLSKREIEIIQLWGEGLTNQEIAEKLFISVRTVESHKNHVMQKINLRTTVDLLKFAIKNNIIRID